MAFSKSITFLRGKLGRDAEHKTVNENTTVTKFSVATENSYKNKQGEWQRKTTWHNVVGFNLSDYNKDRLVKGAEVDLETRFDLNEYEKDGVKKTYPQFIIENNHRMIITQDDSNRLETTPEAKSDNNEDLPF
jgi:single-strand DNA-binding protein